MNENLFVKRKYSISIRDFLEFLRDNPHKNLPVIVEITDDYYIMEYIEGKTLEETVNENKMSSDTIKNLMLQLLDAVEILHNFNIVHRDIKPENIIIDNSGTLKLIDFDIARKIISNQLRDTYLLGTEGYAAPEQYGFSQTDERSDIYAIGAVYNYLIKNSLSEKDATDNQLKKIICKCLSVDKEKRYKNIKKLRFDISTGKFTAYTFFDIVPGFRTGKLWKMVFATLTYILIFFGYALFLLNETPTNNLIDFFGFVTIVLFFLLCSFFFFAIATDFMNIVEKIHFPVRKKWLKQLLLLVIVYLIPYPITFAAHDNLTFVFWGHPINATVGLYCHVVYSIIADFFIGML